MKRFNIKYFTILIFLFGIINSFCVYSLDTDSWRDLNEKEKEVLKEANFIIHNISEATLGAGTHIKINNKSYILTCGHISYKAKNIIVAEDNTGKFRFLYLKKIDKYNDLSLYEIDLEDNFKYIEISDKNVDSTSFVYTVGNPNGNPDIIEDGMVIETTNKYIKSTNRIDHGNSGGALIYNKKLVGVVIERWDFRNGLVLAYSVPLQKIKRFLKGVK